MLDDVQLNHTGEQYILVQNERNSIHFTLLRNKVLARAENLSVWRHMDGSEHKRNT